MFVVRSNHLQMAYLFYYFRPVAGIFDLNLVKVDEALRSSVFDEVISEQGPPDGTVILSSEQSISEKVDKILELFGAYGDIILVR